MSKVDPAQDSCLPIVIAQQPAEPRPASDDAVARVGVRRNGFDEVVADPLLILLAVIVLDELRKQMPKMSLAEREHAIDTLRLHG